MTEFRIRRLEMADERIAGAAHRIGRGAYAVEAELIGFDGIPALRETLEEMRGRPLIWLGAVTDTEELAAFVAYRGDTDPVEIDRVCVAPEWFRRGLASRLLRHLVNDLFPATDFTVTTGAANTPAVALYERLGFTRGEDFAPVPGLTMASFELRRGPHA
ncbi:GNAT family N-acetyltransferase [Streptomyces sp. NPDC002537]